MIPISALQHYAFCPRQCAYIHLECSWQENYLTARGQQLHQRVHSQEAEQRGATRSERSVQVCSWRLNLTGQLDLLEIRQNPLRFTPVEYKRGKPKVSDCDRVQLCAQALCLEEMTATKIERGAIWYWQVKKTRMDSPESAIACAHRASNQSHLGATCPRPTTHRAL